MVRLAARCPVLVFYGGWRQPGDRPEREVNLDPGTYGLYCPVGDYEERGMVGTVAVREG